MHAAYETGLFWSLVDQLMLCKELWCDQMTWIQSYSTLTTSMGFILHWMQCTSSLFLLCLIYLPSSTNTSCVMVYNMWPSVLFCCVTHNICKWICCILWKCMQHILCSAYSSVSMKYHHSFWIRSDELVMECLIKLTIIMIFLL